MNTVRFLFCKYNHQLSDVPENPYGKRFVATRAYRGVLSLFARQPKHCAAFGASFIDMGVVGFALTVSAADTAYLVDNAHHNRVFFCSRVGVARENAQDCQKHN